MDKNRVSRLIQEKKQELHQIEDRLNSLLLVSNKIINNASGIEIMNLINQHPEFPKVIFENVNLKQIGYTRIKEDTTIYTKLLLSRLSMFIDVYADSKRYLKARIEELASLLL